jgi:hypothetical protein
VNVDGQEHSEVIKLVKHIFPTLLSLGCDSDVLVRQLFEPLVLQIIHFQTNRQKIGSQETDVLIDSIMVCILCVPVSYSKTRAYISRKGSLTLRT